MAAFSTTISATIPSMQYSHLKCNPLFHGQSLLFTKPPSTKVFLKPSRKIPQLKCFLADQDNKGTVLNLETIEKKGVKTNQIIPLQKSFGDAISKSFKGLQLQKSADIVGALIGFLVLRDPHAALAATGGRVGGKCFSSRSSTSSSDTSSPHSSTSSSSHSSSSYPRSSTSSSDTSSPHSSTSSSSHSSSSTSSYPHSSTSSSSTSSSSPGYSSSSSSPRDSSTSSSSPRYSSTLSSSPRYSSSSSSTSTSIPDIVPTTSYSNKIVTPTPTYTVPRTKKEDDDLNYSNEIATPTSPSGVGDIAVIDFVWVLIGIFIFIISSYIAFSVLEFVSNRSRSEVDVSATDKTTTVVKTTVFKLQVGLLGAARSLQRDMNCIAEAADTSSPEGLHLLLTDTILALLRHPDFCISSYSSVDVKENIDEGEKIFNQLSIEERAKFDEETLVNADNIRKQTGTSQRTTGFSNEYIVITILVAAEGIHKSPIIKNSEDLKDALHNLASIPSSRIMAVEILWTPQAENDTLSERELLEDYPLLRPL